MGKIKWFNTEPKESVLEAWFRDRVKDLGGRAYKFTSPGRRSVPDRLVIFPGGSIFFVELKRAEKKLTTKQQIEKEFLESLGMRVYGPVDNKKLIMSILFVELLMLPHTRQSEGLPSKQQLSILL